MAFLAAIGEGGGKPGPVLEADDAKTWHFYVNKATAFVQDFGLMAGLVEETGLVGVDKDIFLARLALIHGHIQKARMKSLADASMGGGNTVLAADPT